MANGSSLWREMHELDKGVHELKMEEKPGAQVMMMGGIITNKIGMSKKEIDGFFLITRHAFY